MQPIGTAIQRVLDRGSRTQEDGPVALEERGESGWVTQSTIVVLWKFVLVGKDGVDEQSVGEETSQKRP